MNYVYNQWNILTWPWLLYDKLVKEYFIVMKCWVSQRFTCNNDNNNNNNYYYYYYYNNFISVSYLLASLMKELIGDT